MAGWAVRNPEVAGPPASTEGTLKPKAKPKPAWGAAGLASDGLTAEERELREALEASRQAEEAAAAAAEAEEERQLAAVLEASRVAEEARQRQEKEARVAVEVSFSCACVYGSSCEMRLQSLTPPTFSDRSDCDVNKLRVRQTARARAKLERKRH